MSGKVAAAAAGPVVRVVRTDDMFDGGIGHVIVARRLPSGALGCAFFLVDLFCLGAKDAFYRELAPSDFEGHLGRMAEGGHPAVDLDPASARKLVTGAVAFAAEVGIAPAKDYRAVAGIFGDIDAASSAETFTFGKDGHPLFIPGPNDTPAKMREIQRALERHGRDERGNANAEASLSLVKRFAAALKLDWRTAPGEAQAGPTIEHDATASPQRDA